MFSLGEPQLSFQYSHGLFKILRHNILCIYALAPALLGCSLIYPLVQYDISVLIVLRY